MFRELTIIAALAATMAAAQTAQTLETRKPDRVISISAERFVFNPGKVTIKQGQLVEFVLSSDDTDHGFKIAGTGVDVAIPPSGAGEVRVRFLAKDKGRFFFECSRPCGAGHNIMRGEIVVK
jgi:cytochrome c oxidase subunit 2